jgi:hypothetical protein
MLFLLLESSNTLWNYLMYLDYFHIQLVFDLVMDQWKMKYIIIIIIIMDGKYTENGVFFRQWRCSSQDYCYV